MKQKEAIKRTTEQLVYSKIADALSDIKPGAKKKKFSKKLKKVSKFLAKDISKAIEKDLPKKISKAKKSKKVKALQPAKAGERTFAQPIHQDHSTTEATAVHQ